MQQLFENQTFVLFKNTMSDYDLINLKRREDKKIMLLKKYDEEMKVIWKSEAIKRIQAQDEREFKETHGENAVFIHTKEFTRRNWYDLARRFAD